MILQFHKYQGTGNDFILIDNRKKKIRLSQRNIALLCDRHFGIGADGLMLLQKNLKGLDFDMVYYNSDGRISSFCGNGSRCIVAFAKSLGVIKKNITRFKAYDGLHEARFNGSKIAVRMRDVKKIDRSGSAFILNTGSPHYVQFITNVKKSDIVRKAKTIRYSPAFRKKGINVNFAERKGDAIYVRTYERGVENETLSCGTGVTATALAAAMKGWSSGPDYCQVITPGGKLKVRFINKKNEFTQVWLEGPATLAYKGETNV